MKRAAGEPLIHLRLTTSNDRTWCNARCDRYTLVNVFAKEVTCIACLIKSVEFHEKASWESENRILALGYSRGTKGNFAKLDLP